jgi:hypothetical protein
MKILIKGYGREKGWDTPYPFSRPGILRCVINGKVLRQ